MKALAHLFPDKGIIQVSARLLHQAACVILVSTALLGMCCATAFAQAPFLILAACVQAIQARQVLRGTVAELVKETRRQESEGEASGITVITISSL